MCRGRSRRDGVERETGRRGEGEKGRRGEREKGRKGEGERGLVSRYPGCRYKRPRKKTIDL
jgi:hypothetical protein